MAFSSRVVDELIARCDITEIVSHYVRLTPKGGSLWGLCPFHGEKTPSFHVVPERQMYHCFGCHRGGGVISFVMEAENLPFREAVAFLARQVGMELPEEGEDRAAQRRQRLLELNRAAARHFYRQLQGADGAPGRDYLQERGLSRQTQTRFGLGYAPEGWDRLCRAMTEQGYDKGELLAAGLVVSNSKGGVYDRFRHRVIFPIIDLRGDVIGFGGRTLGAEGAKYLNSPDTPVFHKSRNLFALNLARKKGQDRILLTEGYMDTISLHQAGFDTAVASLGTALTADHARLLAKYTQEVIIAYDADEAGSRAAARAIPLLEKTGLRVKVLSLPGAKDPDEYLKKYGAERFAQLVSRSENHVLYRLQKLREGIELETDMGRVAFAQQAAEVVAGLDSPAERQVFSARAAAMAELTPGVMEKEVELAYERRLREAKKKQLRRDRAPAAQRQPRGRELRYENIRSARAEEGLIRLLMGEPERYAGPELVPEAWFSSPVLKRIFILLAQRAREGGTLSADCLAGDLEKEEQALFAEILQEPETRENSGDAFADYCSIMETEYIRRSTQEENLLLAIRDRYREKKGMGKNHD